MSTISTMSAIPSNTSSPQQGVPDQRTASSAAQKNKPMATANAAAPTRPLQGTQATALASSHKTEPSSEELKRITEALQRRVSVAAPELQFSIDKSSGRSVIKVMDSATNEVIRQIPSAETLQIDQNLDRFQKGVLINRKA